MEVNLAGEGAEPGFHVAQASEDLARLRFGYCGHSRRTMSRARIGEGDANGMRLVYSRKVQLRDRT